MQTLYQCFINPYIYNYIVYFIDAWEGISKKNLLLNYETPNACSKIN